jgi:hypothetical protein
MSFENNYTASSYNKLKYLSICLWRWYIKVTITILDIIHRPVSYLRYGVSEIRFCIRLQVEPTQLGPIDPVRKQRLAPYIGPN